MDGNQNLHAPAVGTAVTTHHDPPGEAPISRLVAELVAKCPGERITIAEMTEAFGERAFGILILMLCLPGLLPGMACVFGAPILILGVQMGIGMRRPVFPGFIARLSLKRTDVMRMSSGSSRWLSKVERWVKPRPGPFTSPFADRVVGWLSAYAALMLILPGPGTNGPPAFGTMVMTLGVLENDSRVIGWGMLLTFLGNLFATVVLGLVAWFGFEALNWVWNYFF